MYDLDSIMGFGKYANSTVEDVLEDDPSYLRWCLENIPRFTVDDALHDAIMEACRRRRNPAGRS